MPTAIEIFKHLPKTNCGECGFPTCLAFAMQLANQKVSLDDCPYVSDDAKEALEASSAPPIRLIKIGTGENQVEVGEETELYRHEKKFFHQTAYSIIVSDSASEEERKEKVEKVKDLEFERVGQMLTVDMIGVRNDSGDAGTFASVVEEVAGATDLPLVLFSEDPGAMGTAVEKVKERKPLLHAATADNAEEMAKVAKDAGCPLVVFEDSGLDAL
ncbi:MAG: (Fe-S)-binding protein, partial [Methanomassiliicoccales archaeon]